MMGFDRAEDVVWRDKAQKRSCAREDYSLNMQAMGRSVMLWATQQLLATGFVTQQISCEKTPKKVKVGASNEHPSKLRESK